MSLASYILRRVLLLVPTLFGVSLLTFALSRIVPGDPARLAAGAQATPEMYEQIRQEFGLDDPLPVQYWNYLSGLFQGDWGRSILSRRPVLDDLAVYWPATFELVLFAMLIAVAARCPAGDPRGGARRSAGGPGLPGRRAPRREPAGLLAGHPVSDLFRASARLAAGERASRLPGRGAADAHRALHGR